MASSSGSVALTPEAIKLLEQFVELRNGIEANIAMLDVTTATIDQHLDLLNEEQLQELRDALSNVQLSLDNELAASDPLANSLTSFLSQVKQTALICDKFGPTFEKMATMASITEQVYDMERNFVDQTKKMQTFRKGYNLLIESEIPEDLSLPASMQPIPLDLQYKINKATDTINRKVLEISKRVIYFQRRINLLKNVNGLKKHETSAELSQDLDETLSRIKHLEIYVDNEKNLLELSQNLEKMNLKEGLAAKIAKKLEEKEGVIYKVAAPALAERNVQVKSQPPKVDDDKIAQSFVNKKPQELKPLLLKQQTPRVLQLVVQTPEPAPSSPAPIPASTPALFKPEAPKTEVNAATTGATGSFTGFSFKPAQLSQQPQPSQQPQTSQQPQPSQQPQSSFNFAPKPAGTTSLATTTTKENNNADIEGDKGQALISKVAAPALAESNVQVKSQSTKVDDDKIAQSFVNKKPEELKQQTPTVLQSVNQTPEPSAPNPAPIPSSTPFSFKPEAPKTEVNAPTIGATGGFTKFSFKPAQPSQQPQTSFSFAPKPAGTTSMFGGGMATTTTTDNNNADMEDDMSQSGMNFDNTGLGGTPQNKSGSGFGNLDFSTLGKKPSPFGSFALKPQTGGVQPFGSTNSSAQPSSTGFGSTSFGAAPSFGSGPSFGSAPQPSSVFGGKPIFGGGSSGTGTAAQPASGGFAAFANKGSSFGQLAQGSGSMFGGGPQTTASSFGGGTGFGNPSFSTQQNSSPAFTAFRK